jgi:serine acetyltransferase
MLSHLRKDIESVFTRDPAARSRLENIVSIPAVSVSQEETWFYTI